MLIFSGLGPEYDGTVQLFNEGGWDIGEPGRLLLKETLEEGDGTRGSGSVYCPWNHKKTRLWFRGSSWVDWLHKQLEVLEETLEKEVVSEELKPN